MTSNANPKLKRVFCVLAACAMMASAAGCNNSSSGSSQTEESSTASAADSSASTSTSSSTSSSTGDSIEAIGFEAQIVPPLDEPIMQYPVENGGKISMWVGFNSISAKYYQSLAEDITVKQYVEDTGIEVEFVHPASGQESENFNLLVVSDSLPDIVVNADSYYAGGISAAVADGVFADLTDLVAEYAPDYNYFLENNDMFWRLASTDDGKIYQLYNYKDIQAPYYWRSQFRSDWLEEFGMDTPKTFADMEEYFKKVQENYPDVAPYTLVKDGLEWEFLAAFDAATVDNQKRFFVVDGQVQHTFTSPGLEDYLTLMADWYQKGYINKDFTTVESVEQELCNGRTAFIVGNTDTVYVLADELGVEIDSAPYPRVNEGDPYHGDIFYFPQNGTPSAINAKSSNIELALQFLNYGFTKQGSAVVNYGDPDTSWNWSEEVYPDYQTTIPEYTDYALNCPDYPMSDIEYTVRLHTAWTKYRYGDDVMMIRNVADPDCWAYRAQWGDDPTADTNYVLPSLNFSTEAASEISTLVTNINTYGEEMILKFITGATPLSEYDNFVAEINNLGMPRLLELYQEAYEALLSKSR